MSVTLECEQGSEQWRLARCGVVTSSEFGKIVTTTGTASSQAVAYRRKLLAEWLTGQPVDSLDGMRWVDRGKEKEPEARAYYEFVAGNNVDEVGLIYLDERRLISCSPDGLVGDDGGLEIKNPAPHTHLGYLIDAKLPTAYVAQVQGSLWVTGRQWWDFLSYRPDIEPLIVRVRRDEAYIAKLATCIEAFVAKLLQERDRLVAQGIVPVGGYGHRERPDTDAQADCGQNQNSDNHREKRPMVREFLV